MLVQKSGEALKLLYIQALLLLLSPFALLPFGITAIYSGLLGGAIAVVSSLMMSLMVFKNYRAQQPEKIVAKFYSAEITKLIFTMAAFALIVIKVEPLNFVSLILVYFVIQVLPAVIINFR